ncbi:hypothetical protein KAT59_06915 [Candidatus Bipolaricaulota bacterium]|nr:hypothetical protein [Candidatus Bipolaricaulota bacterium]
MRRVCVAGLLILLLGMVAASQTTLNLTPRVLTATDGVVYLFDNETGVSQTTLVLVLGGGVSLEPSDIVVFGGSEVTAINQWGGGALTAINVEVVAGGTVQITLSGDNAAGSISLAWFSPK